MAKQVNVTPQQSLQNQRDLQAQEFMAATAVAPAIRSLPSSYGISNNISAHSLQVRFLDNSRIAVKCYKTADCKDISLGIYQNRIKPQMETTWKNLRFKAEEDILAAQEYFRCENQQALLELNNVNSKFFGDRYWYDQSYSKLLRAYQSTVKSRLVFLYGYECVDFRDCNDTIILVIFITPPRINY